MGSPAARVGDEHSCPKDESGAPHVGGPISSGAGSVFINGKSAARVGDAAVCHCATDSIVAGSATVFVEGKATARVGDASAHGGKITAGSANVLIGG